MSRFALDRTRRLFAIAAVVIAAVVAADCEDNLSAGNACPLVCPQESQSPRDTTLSDGIVIDSSLPGFPPIGAESNILMAFRKDTFETRGILRFDSLTNFYQIEGTESNAPIAHIDSAFVVATRPAIDSTLALKSAVTLNLFDVSDVDDTTASVLSALFTPSRQIGTITIDSLRDTIKIPLNTDTLLAKMKLSAVLRVGVAVVSDSAVNIRFESAQIGLGPLIRVYPKTGDSLQPPVNIATRSKTPSDQPFLAARLSDFTILAMGQPPPAAGAFRVGDFPWRRVFLRLHLPSSIVDSTAVIRATLLLTQSPIHSPEGPRDSVTVAPFVILSSPAITSIAHLLEFATAASFPVGIDTLVPRDSGLRQIEIVNVLRVWAGVPDSVTPRVLALEINTEGNFGNAIDFFGLSAPAAVRPKVRITYVPRPKIGLP